MLSGLRLESFKSFMSPRVKNIFLLVLILVLAGAWRFWLLARDAFPFNADEAVVGLMARHILSGERPIFFYGQAYMGSLDAYLVAGAFSILGQSVWAIRLVQILLHMATIITTVAIGVLAFKSVKTGLMAGLLLALPPVNSLLYTTVSLGGYGEAMLLGSLNLLVGLLLFDRLRQPAPRRSGWLFLLWGFLTGLGLWENGLTLVFALPAAGLLAWVLAGNSTRAAGAWKFALAAIPGALIGSLPWWLFAFQNGLNSLLGELFGSAVAVEEGSWLGRALSHLLNFFILGVPAAAGFRPPWEVRWLALPLIPFVLIFGVVVLIHWGKVIFSNTKLRPAFLACAGVVLVLGLAFVGSAFGVDPSGRYFLPLSIPFALVTADFLTSQVTRRALAIGGAGLLLVFNLWGTLECASSNPPGITTQFNPASVVDQSQMPALQAFLRQSGELRGYTNYWVAYPLAFLSGEELIFTPRLPYQADLRFTSRDDRYAPYDSMVSQASQVAYITTSNPLLDDKLRAGLAGLGVTWQEKQIGDFRVFYHFSRLVRPQQLGLGG